MTDSLFGFIVFWGVWLFVPMLIDGVTAVAYFFGAFRARKRGEPAPVTEFPLVSLIIPVYNGAKVIPQCIEAVRRQTYPHRSIEVLVVDNQSTDETRQVIIEEQSKPFGGRILWLSLPYRGKPGALNAGMHRVNGEIICNIDADTILHKNAVLEMVRAFQEDPKLAAATGSIEVTPADRDPSAAPGERYTRPAPSWERPSS